MMCRRTGTQRANRSSQGRSCRAAAPRLVRARRRRQRKPAPVKLRPFAVFLDPNDDQQRQRDSLPLLHLGAAIDGDSFLLSVGAATVRLAAHRVGADEHGEYALVDVGAGPSLTGFRISVETICSIEDHCDTTGSMVVIVRDAAPSSCLAICFGADGATSFLKERTSDS